MDMESRDRHKVRGLRRLFKSFKYSYEGIKYAYTKEQSMTIHLTITAFVIMAGIIYQITYTEWLLCIVMIAIILAIELLNTSIEAVVDLACPKIHPLAKIAKDTASGAVLIFAIAAFVIGLMIFLPHVIDTLGGLL
jgi:diacylglycerol kinase